MLSKLNEINNNLIKYVCYTQRLNLFNFTPVPSCIWELQIYTD